MMESRFCLCSLSFLYIIFNLYQNSRACYHYPHLVYLWNVKQLVQDGTAVKWWSQPWLQAGLTLNKKPDTFSCIIPLALTKLPPPHSLPEYLLSKYSGAQIGKPASTARSSWALWRAHAWPSHKHLQKKIFFLWFCLFCLTLEEKIVFASKLCIFIISTL